MINKIETCLNPKSHTSDQRTRAGFHVSNKDGLSKILNESKKTELMQ
jgi:hypothetical protein